MRLNFLVFFTTLILIGSCGRISADEAQLRECVADRVPIGNEVWESLTIFENHLISTGLLTDRSKQSFHLMYESRNFGSAAEIAPYVRDFWELRAPVTSTAFSVCLENLSNQLGENNTLQFLNLDEEGSSNLNQLNVIPESDFNSSTYRAAFLLDIIQRMEP